MSSFFDMDGGYWTCVFNHRGETCVQSDVQVDSTKILHLYLYGNGENETVEAYSLNFSQSVVFDCCFH